MHVSSKVFTSAATRTLGGLQVWSLSKNQELMDERVASPDQHSLVASCPNAVGGIIDDIHTRRPGDNPDALSCRAQALIQTQSCYAGGRYLKVVKFKQFVVSLPTAGVQYAVA
jgi:hypothetical protein